LPVVNLQCFYRKSYSRWRAPEEEIWSKSELPPHWDQKCIELAYQEKFDDQNFGTTICLLWCEELPQRFWSVLAVSKLEKWLYSHLLMMLQKFTDICRFSLLFVGLHWFFIEFSLVFVGWSQSIIFWLWKSKLWWIYGCTITFPT